jgi:hypothetical protein
MKEEIEEILNHYTYINDYGHYVFIEDVIDNGVLIDFDLSLVSRDIIKKFNEKRSAGA